MVIFRERDDDISFPPEAIDILIDDNKPIVGGIYTFKTTDPNYVGKACTRFFKKQVLHENGPFEVQWLNGGFILVKKDVLLTMIDAYDDLRFDWPKEGKSITDAEKTWALWCPMVYKDLQSRIFLGEDWSFCHRARQIGFDIWADLRVKLIHWNGEKGFSIGL
jgi:GT2 family glycosyltransferase